MTPCVMLAMGNAVKGQRRPDRTVSDEIRFMISRYAAGETGFSRSLVSAERA